MRGPGRGKRFTKIGPVGRSNHVGPRIGNVTSDDFVIAVKTDNPGSSSDNQFGFGATGTYDIDWGDGTTETLTGDGSHTYATSGTYTIKITNTIEAFSCRGQSDERKVVELKNWGTAGWTSMNGMFERCFNIVFTASDAPNTTGVSGTGFRRVFWDCLLVTELPFFDTSNGTSINNMFNGLASLSEVPLYDLSNITSANGAFTSTTLTTENYSDILVHLADNNFNTGVTFSGGSSTYNTAGGIARDVLTNDRSWNISDGGAA